MKKVALLLVATALIATTFSSCKKEECPVDEPTKTELLTAKEWNGVDLKVFVNDVEEDGENITSLKWAFLTNMDMIWYNNDVPGDVMQWRFLSNETQIQFIFDAYTRSGFPQIWDIKKLTTTSLELKYTEVDGGDTLRYEMHFSH